jgi:glycosyltransferase involved in cell wall biosynthesis
VQIIFPKKIKTAKYAGNWDPRSKQPLSYNLQKYILNNTFLTKNMQTLVYGKWKDMSGNIKSFFTASYCRSEIEGPIKRNFLPPYRFIFIGTLVPGKRPLLSVKIMESLFRNDIECTLDIFGDGILNQEIKDYVVSNNLKSKIQFHGNVSKENLKIALKNSDFLLLPSRSEGWPKVVAEAMFFGVIPITTNVSCLGWMLDEGRRGILIKEDLILATNKIKESICKDNLLSMSIACQHWSHEYTIDRFETEIKKLLSKE